MKIKQRALKDEPWYAELKQALEETFDKRFELLFEKTRKRLRDRAVWDIARGVQFCLEKGLKLSVTLSRNFNIGCACSCLLAKNSAERDYESALWEQRLSYRSAEMMGFEPSQKVFDLLILEFPNWYQIYNCLWRKVGRFFRAHPKFGAR